MVEDLGKVCGGVVLIFICPLLGTTLNLLSLCYFHLSSIHPVFRRLYMTTAALDTLTCLVSSLNFVSLILGRSPVEDEIFLGIWAVVYGFLMTLSTHILLFLTCTRLAKICFPRHVINLTVLSVAFAADLLITAALITFTHHSLGVQFYQRVSFPSYRVTRKIPFLQLIGVAIHVCWIILPLPLILVCYVSMLVCLKAQRGRPEVDRVLRQSFQTVVTLAGVYLAFNATFGVTIVILFFVKTPPESLRSLLSVVITSNIPLNAAANPIVYLCRQSDFQVFCRNLWECLRRKFRPRPEITRVRVIELRNIPDPVISSSSSTEYHRVYIPLVTTSSSTSEYYSSHDCFTSETSPGIGATAEMETTV